MGSSILKICMYYCDVHLSCKYIFSDTKFCWEIVEVGNFTYILNRTCEISKQTRHTLALVIPEAGVYQLLVDIENNVSSVSQQSQLLYVQDPIIPCEYM